VLIEQSFKTILVTTSFFILFIGHKQ